MNSYNPLVSIIINCYNGEKYLKEALNSVTEQSYENWEIIFWNLPNLPNPAVSKAAVISKNRIAG